MHFLDLTLSTPAENLALDEALLLDAEAGGGGEVLRLWELPRYAVVLGAGCKLAEDVDEPSCVADGVPILRRASGGGTVLLGPGCLCFSVVLAYDRDPLLRDVNASYRYILPRMAAAIADLLPDVQPSGTSDLASLGRKCSGNAQQRKKTFLLHHGTLLYDLDRTRVSRYLRNPTRQPEYRENRTHGDFLLNLPTTDTELRERLRTVWGAREQQPFWPVVRTRELMAEKYGRDDWIRRR